jgi:hypothetical protein
MQQDQESTIIDPTGARQVDAVHVEKAAGHIKQPGSHDIEPSDVDQDGEKLVLSVVAEATPSALRADPATVNLGVVHVGICQRQNVRLINESGGLVRYVMRIVAHEAGNCFSGDGAVPCIFGGGGLAELCGTGCSVSGRGGGHGPDDAAIAWVEQEEGFISARCADHP